MTFSKGIRPFKERKPAADRFWRFVAPMMDDRGCWEWAGSLKAGNSKKLAKWRYGKFSIGGKRAWVQAQRFCWELHFGKIPEGMCVLHRCDNPPCVNPSHLFLGTFKDNTHDMWTKGRAYDSTPHMRSALKRKREQDREQSRA